jgi:hypothetical protein
MGRKRIYANDTERQRAWRDRLKGQVTGQLPVLNLPSKAKRPPSRPARLQALLAEVQALQTEYEDWFAALPESLSESQLAERLTETIDQFQVAADMLAEIEVPKGFGRD